MNLIFKVIFLLPIVVAHTARSIYRSETTNKGLNILIKVVLFILSIFLLDVLITY